jgi:hypothetical protein
MWQRFICSVRVLVLVCTGGDWDASSGAEGAESEDEDVSTPVSARGVRQKIGDNLGNAILTLICFLCACKSSALRGGKIMGRARQLSLPWRLSVSTSY